MSIVSDLLKIRMKPKWRGTIIAVAGVSAGNIVFYCSARPSKILLWILFVITFIGGALSFIDSIRQFAAARRQIKQTGNKNDAES